MTARDTIEAELKQMVFDLLHEQDMDDLKDGEKKALAHTGGTRSKRRPPSAAF